MVYLQGVPLVATDEGWWLSAWIRFPAAATMTLGEIKKYLDRHKLSCYNLSDDPQGGQDV